jgi:hypothetical protein
MEDNSNLLESALNLAKSCLLPPLNFDLDSNPIAESDFKEFQIIFSDNCHLLLDILHQNLHLLTQQAYDNQTIQLRINLVLLMCEQTEENPYFQTKDRILLNTLKKVTLDHLDDFEDSIFHKLIQHYIASLNKSLWKRQLGMIHGFPMFCQIFLKHKSKLVNCDNVMFILSVGSNLVAHYEPHYKTIGFKIYLHLMTLCDREHLKKYNIHSVIFNEAFPMIQRSNELNYNRYLYETLYHVVVIEDSVIKNTDWCNFDKVMSKLITHFSLESDVDLSNLLLYNIFIFCCIGHENFTPKLHELHSQDVIECEMYFNALEEKFRKQNRRAMRWSKKLMEMLTRESCKIFSNADNAFFVLKMFNLIYLCVFFGFDEKDFRETLAEFTQKFILILMRAANVYSDRCDLKKLILAILSTLEHHQKENLELAECLLDIKQHEKFRISKN